MEWLLCVGVVLQQIQVDIKAIFSIVLFCRYNLL